MVCSAFVILNSFASCSLDRMLSTMGLVNGANEVNILRDPFTSNPYGVNGFGKLIKQFGKWENIVYIKQC